MTELVSLLAVQVGKMLLNMPAGSVHVYQYDVIGFLRLGTSLLQGQGLPLDAKEISKDTAIESVSRGLLEACPS